MPSSDCESDSSSDSFLSNSDVGDNYEITAKQSKEATPKFKRKLVVQQKNIACHTKADVKRKTKEQNV